MNNLPSIEEREKMVAEQLKDELEFHINSGRNFTNVDIRFLCELATKNGNLYEFYNLMIEHYKHSTNFNTAEWSFDHCIQPFISAFDKEQILALLDSVNSNRQVHDTRRRYFTSEIKQIKARADELLESDFEYETKSPDINFLK
ncbi:hypothetical protein [Paenibacillus sp. NPDC057934]|uniref:hypothetical protein n=1 Tax=Paenibacillus sp. NPDC057934 TaxID=3346282 RepID=UPI0036DA405A